MSEARKLGELLRAAYEAGRDEQDGFEQWLADNGDEVLAVVAEIAEQVRAQDTAGCVAEKCNATIQHWNGAGVDTCVREVHEVRELPDDARLAGPQFAAALATWHRSKGANHQWADSAATAKPHVRRP